MVIRVSTPLRLQTLRSVDFRAILWVLAGRVTARAPWRGMRILHLSPPVCFDCRPSHCQVSEDCSQVERSRRNATLELTTLNISLTVLWKHRPVGGKADDESRTKTTLAPKRQFDRRTYRLKVFVANQNDR